MTAPPRMSVPWLALAAALVTTVAVTALGDPRIPGALGPYVLVIGGIAVLALVGRPGARGVGLAALLVRLPLLALPAVYSDDVYRYVWEGRVWLSGDNPFVLAPDDPALTPLRDATWALVNHREVSSIYPPLAQLLFVLLSPGGVLAWKAAMALADVGTATLLAKRDPRAGWVWALLPLVALESAGSGHLEGVGVLLLVAALGRRPWAAWAGALVKLLPAVALLPLLWDRRRWPLLAGMAGAGVLVSLPLLAAGPALWRGFETYRQTWSYNGSLYPLAAAVMNADTARSLLQLVGVGITVAIALRSRDPARVALWVTGAFVALSPTVHPWYVLWPLAAALWTRTRAWEGLAVGIPLSYVVLATYDPATSSWVEPTWPKLVVYPAFYAALLAEAAWALTRPNPRSVG